ncbi:hypothetical protein BCF55_0954 [Hydrogenivirga caldilitoris]|uniref:Uncharacterized protein n=1 Tax=Hydrogenivirga caldilitoris TaxID=246264 RepID=A0A497XUW9_9AQUI|nr:hypothetical protein BCF55_0954 [Hydrogenivirga caldilitoris]
MSWEWYFFMIPIFIFIVSLLFLTYEVLKTPDKEEKTT